MCRKDVLLRLIDEAYNSSSWHGTNLRGSIRGLSAGQAARRIGPGRRSIAEIVVHCAYWKYAVRRRLRGDKRGSFPLAGNNWFALPRTLTRALWRQYVTLLDSEHAALRAALADLLPTALERRHDGRKPGNLIRIRGVALHDVYHAGQIQLIRRVLGPRRAAAR